MISLAIKNRFSKIIAGRNYLSILVCLCMVASCSLKPVYYSKYNVPELNQLNAIEVEQINSIEGAEFLYHLSNILPKDTSLRAKYLLKISLSTTKLPSVIQKNSDVLWEIINQIVQYRLIDINTGKEVTSGRFSHKTSYNINSLVYSSYVESETANQDLTKQAAEEIIARLIVYFEKAN